MISAACKGLWNRSIIFMYILFCLALAVYHLRGRGAFFALQGGGGMQTSAATHLFNVCAEILMTYGLLPVDSQIKIFGF